MRVFCKGGACQVCFRGESFFGMCGRRQLHVILTRLAIQVVALFS